MTANGPRPRQPWDPGLQTERTALAWLRTTLAFTVGVLVLLRLLAWHSVLAAAVCAVVLVPLVAGSTWLTWRRNLQEERRLHAARPLPGAGLHAAVTAAVVLTGAAALLYIVL
ncbi:DUF202 domain-containing protein [Salinifilum ghardaiensis]